MFGICSVDVQHNRNVFKNAKTSQGRYAINEVYRSVYFSLVLDPRDRIDLLPVAVRVTSRGKRRYYRSGLKLTTDNFDKLLRANKGPYYEMRCEQKKFFDKIVSLSKKLIDDDMFSFEKLSCQLNGDSSEESFVTLFKKKINALKENGQVATAWTYEYTLKKLVERCGNDIPFQRISVEFIENFKSTMVKEGLTQTSIAIYLRNIRTVCNMALSGDFIKPSQYPFRAKSGETNKVRISKGSKRKESFLKVDEILKLWSYDTEEHKQNSYDKVVCEALNMWMFSYLANGLNLKDMGFLTYNDHYFRSKGREFSFKRKKTERTVNEEIIIYVPIIDSLKKILDEYGTKPSRGRFVFPGILEGETNEDLIMKKLRQENKNIAHRLEKVCKEVGIEEKVTMTWARHSYQTNLAHKKVPESYIDQAVGHTDGTITEGYIGLYTTEDRFRYNSLLLEPDKEA